MSFQYDYIIAGMGCAGLSLALEMERTGFALGKRILLIDREPKEKNDRTWCFWEARPGPFESIVYRRWPKAWFRSSSFESLLQLGPYEYKMIRGIDFYRYANEILATSEIEVRYANMVEVGGEAGNAFLRDSNLRTYTARQVFNSIPSAMLSMGKKEHYLLQHFRGWIIDTAEPVFDPAVATLMDFRVSQEEGCTFGYVLPFSEHRALVEYTLFSAEKLSSGQYDQGLKNYIEHFLNISSYQISEQEDGVIPMTSHHFKNPSSGVILIGTAGGQTKASSGYTFQFIQKHSREIVSRLQEKTLVDYSAESIAARFRFYDKVLLDVLAEGRMSGEKVFTTLFKKNPAPRVLAFLDNETTLIQELSIIATLPVPPFLKAAAAQL